jgi:CRP/FNR family cyclic AMP-dependent transcriptional regulator
VIHRRQVQHLGELVIVEADDREVVRHAVLKSVPEPIAGTLTVMAASRHPKPMGRGLQVRLTHEQIAALAGTSRETTTKVLGELADLGLISRGRGLITLHNLDQLTKLASE